MRMYWFMSSSIIAALSASAAFAGERLCQSALNASDMTNLESCAQYGHGNVLCTRRPGNIRGSATWTFHIREPGSYNVQITYASKNVP